MEITKAILDNLTAQAKASPRLRMNMDLRNGQEDGSQRRRAQEEYERMLGEGRSQ